MDSIMYTIGEFAAYGRVSARMLRHYDKIGLLEPRRVDEYTGYRHYDPAQLAQLLRIVELRELGCSLDDAAFVLGADDEEAALRVVLARRRGELADAVAADTARIARIDARLSLPEGTTPMADITYTSLPAVTVYAATAVAGGMGPQFVSPVIDEILPPLLHALQESGVEFHEPGTFWYEPVEGTDGLRVWVSWIAGDEPVENDAWQVVELPAVEHAAVYDYRGDMPGIGGAYHELMTGLAEAGVELAGPSREVYLESEPLPQSEWLTQLQQPIVAPPAR
ncbi:MerR family transcriptional regulator [Microbacterium aoyamense]|uniref:MerR family transcriptional regulator n=1 Tax=Microbacterium aoyamense TaxID=344166 RepID=A0ABN2PYC8_9MICO|nr:MerR family transcriptional regulator [Microbacterium aoyamense]